MSLRCGITTGTCPRRLPRRRPPFFSAVVRRVTSNCGYRRARRFACRSLYVESRQSPAAATAACPQGRRRRSRRDAWPGGSSQGFLGRRGCAQAAGPSLPAHSQCSSQGVTFVAGEGVGTVTKPGLQVPPGEPAINPIPRRMIVAAVREITARGVRVEISLPGGREIAAKTFNPRLGIEGGLSILGTTGIVRPYCTRAVRDALTCALDVAAACGVTAPVLVPGNIGAAPPVAISRSARSR